MRSGQLTLQMLIFGAIAVMVIGGFVTWLQVINRVVSQNANKDQAFAIAEAGIEYYRWHLAHAPLDYSDGTSTTGPYVHDFADKNGNVVGQFVLDIVPPPANTTIVTITSTGKILKDLSAGKVIKVRMGIQSYAKYAALTDAINRFGVGTEVFGPIHSNNGIRFDGLAHNLVTSAASDYDDPDHTGANEYGVHTHRNLPPSTTTNDNFRPLEAPTSTLETRNDIFLAGRQLGAPGVDFTKITQTLNQIKLDAQSGTGYYPSSTALGYHLILKTDNTFDLFKVTSLVSAPTSSGSCTSSQNQASNQTGWGTWSVQNELKLATSTPFPANNLLFLEDDLWIDGQIKNARLTVGAGRFPENASTSASIMVNKDLRYTNADGTDVIGLISQKNVTVGMISSSTLRIDGALIAQNGRVGRYYYNSACTPYNSRQQITTYGMIGSSQRYGFAYTSASNPGYQIRSLTYDPNLVYGPPPSFPLTTDQYTLISWDEVR